MADETPFLDEDGLQPIPIWYRLPEYVERNQIRIEELESGTIESIQEGTNITIDNTDPRNPIISAQIDGNEVNWGDIIGDISNQTDLQNILSNKINVGGNISDLTNNVGYITNADIPIESIQEGTNITIDVSDPKNPIINAIGLSSIEWGNITGNIINQTDLQAALDEKADDDVVVHIGDDISLLNNDAGYITSGDLPPETDPIFSASPAAGITNPDITTWNNKLTSVVAGDNITVDNTDPLSPIISAADQAQINWGDIQGTLSNQTDLQTALDTKIESGDNVSELVNDAGYLTESQANLIYQGLSPTLTEISLLGIPDPADPDKNLSWDSASQAMVWTDKPTASDIPVTPSGNITSTDVQAALEELQGDIDSALALDLQATTDNGNETSNALILTGADNINLSTDGLVLFRSTGLNQIGSIEAGAVNGSLIFGTTEVVLQYQYAGGTEDSSISFREEGPNQGEAGIRVTGRLAGNPALHDDELVTLLQLGDYQLLSEKGQPNGYAPTDGTNRIPIEFMPVEVVHLIGNWNASTNTPTLTDGVGTQGDSYQVTVAGTQDLGSGSINFAVDDLVVYNGTVWFKVTGGFSHQNLTFSGGQLSISNGNSVDLDSRYYTETETDGILGGKEDLANKAADFTTLNNTLYPTTQAVADYVASEQPAAQTLSLGSNSGTVSISDGNTVRMQNINRGNRPDANTPESTQGLYPFLNTSGSTGYPSTTGLGLFIQRSDGNIGDTFQLWKNANGLDQLYYKTDDNPFHIIANLDNTITQGVNSNGGNIPAAAPDLNTIEGNNVFYATSGAINSPGNSIIVNFEHSNGYKQQLSLRADINTPGYHPLRYRGYNAFNETWTGWRSVWDDNNLPDPATDSDVLHTTGDDTQIVLGNDTPALSHFEYGLGKSNQISDFNLINKNNSIHYGSLSALNRPQTGVSTVITFANQDDVSTLGGQIALTYSGISGAYSNPTLSIRSKSGANTWYPWRNVWDDNNLPDPATETWVNSQGFLTSPSTLQEVTDQPSGNTTTNSLRVLGDTSGEYAEILGGTNPGIHYGRGNEHYYFRPIGTYLDFTTPIGNGTSNSSSKLRLFNVDNRDVEGDPNAHVATFNGRVKASPAKDSDDVLTGLNAGFGMSWNDTTNGLDWGESDTIGASPYHYVPVNSGQFFSFGDINNTNSPYLLINRSGTTTDGIQIGSSQVNADSPSTLVLNEGKSEWLIDNPAAESKSIVMDSSVVGILITDEISQNGLRYPVDYSATWTDRNLVDKGYVDSTITNRLQFFLPPTWNPGTVAAGDSVSVNFTLTGASTTDAIVVMDYDTLIDTGVLAKAQVISADTVRVTLTNAQTTSIDIIGLNLGLKIIK